MMLIVYEVDNTAIIDLEYDEKFTLKDLFETAKEIAAANDKIEVRDISIRFVDPPDRQSPKHPNAASDADDQGQS